MEQDFYKGFVYWVYRCLSTEVVITYRVENEVRHIHVYNPLWLVNYSAKDIECLFVNKIGFKAGDRDQAMQFQKIEKKMAKKVEKERKAHEERDNMLRHTVVQRMAAEEKKRVGENEKLRKLLLRKPKPRKEKCKSL
ncbi:hypothetical protein Hanom_Chr07g00645121 [Helianthus anomalus]